MYDPDEIDEEQRERHLRKKLNEIFKEFCKKVERVAKYYDYDLEFDIPYRDLGFHGVPHREMVLIQPTVHCLVNLTETPFFIIDLKSVLSTAAHHYFYSLVLARCLSSNIGRACSLRAVHTSSDKL